ncbi:MAG TPA: hypothetical protein VME67_03705 [Mycobacterium sp.]|nr:hypothetical protein [Mycobacterium sp.]HTX94008.1 hypothetical protein [Mycobacterium sp.]
MEGPEKEEGAGPKSDATQNNTVTNQHGYSTPRGIKPLADHLAELGVDASQVLTFGDVLDRLNIGADEHVSLFGARQRVKQADQTASKVMTAAGAAAAAVEHLAGTNGAAWNAYFAPSTTTLPLGAGRGRGTENQIEAVHACFGDLDVKLGACPSLDVAHLVVDELVAQTGVRPTVLIYSGAGLQPLWAFAEGVAPEVGVPLIRRFGRLVRKAAAVVGEELGLPAIAVDSVFDGCRVLRMPGSHNFKYIPAPPVVAVAGGGEPVDAELFAAALDAAGVGAETGDNRIGLGEVQSDPETWKFAGSSCGYAVKTILSWLAETPTQRHPRALAWYTRLAAMKAYGCLTARDYAEADRAIGRHFEKLLATRGTPRAVGSRRHPETGLPVTEIDDMREVGVDRVSRKTPEQLAAELGEHVHLAKGSPK